MLTKYPITDSGGELSRTTFELINSPLDAGFLPHVSCTSQTTLHFNTQTSLLARGAKSFAMQTLSEQVKAFMKREAEKRGVEKLMPADMAKLVAEQQSDLPAKERCTRQNIETLFRKSSKVPQYIDALARAMGTTVETLMAGKFSPDEHAIDSPAQSGEHLHVITDEEWLMLQNFRAMIDRDRKRLTSEIEERADVAREMLDRVREEQKLSVPLVSKTPGPANKPKQVKVTPK